MVTDYSNKSLLGFRAKEIHLNVWLEHNISLSPHPFFTYCYMFISLLCTFHFPFVKQVSCLKHFLSPSLSRKLDCFAL